jgi:hypothetical protein
MANKIEEVWTEVVNILKNANQPGGSLEYVKEIIQGRREDIEQFPTIIVHPLDTAEVIHTIPRQKKITFRIEITCWIDVYGKDIRITGDANNKGMFDIEKDIKNELEKYPNLNGKCTIFSFPATEYIANPEEFPYTGVKIIMATEIIAIATNR